MPQTSITDMIEHIKDNGVSRSNKFSVEISIPVGLSKTTEYKTVAARHITLSCIGTELPGRRFSTADKKIHGPVVHMPYEQTMGQQTLNFIATEQHFEKAFFDAWQNIILSPITFDWGYFHDYISTIKIQQFGKMGTVVYEVTLYQAWPTDVNDISLSMDSMDTLSTLNVAFSYVTWEDTTNRAAVMKRQLDAIKIPNPGVISAVPHNDNLTDETKLSMKDKLIQKMKDAKPNIPNINVGGQTITSSDINKGISKLPNH